MTGFTGWCWVDDQGVFRRARTEELRNAIASGSLAIDIPVWREGMAAFLPARVFAAFSDLATGDLSHAVQAGGADQLPGEPIEPLEEQLSAYRRTQAVTRSVPAPALTSQPRGSVRPSRAVRSEPPPAAGVVRRPSIPPPKHPSKEAPPVESIPEDMPTIPKAPLPPEQIPEDMPTIPRAGLPLSPALIGKRNALAGAGMPDVSDAGQKAAANNAAEASAVATKQVLEKKERAEPQPKAEPKVSKAQPSVPPPRAEAVARPQSAEPARKAEPLVAKAEPKVSKAQPSVRPPKAEPVASGPQPAVPQPKAEPVAEKKDAAPAGEGRKAGGTKDDKGDRAEAPEDATAKYAAPPRVTATEGGERQEPKPVRDPSHPLGFRGVSAEFFREGDEIEQRWPEEGSASQPALESVGHPSLPGPEIEVQPIGLWQEIGLRVRHEKWFWWMVAGLGAIVLLGMSGLLVPLFRSRPQELPPESLGAGLDGSPATSAPAEAQSVSGIVPAAAPSSSLAACVIAHPPERLAATAWKEVPPEVWVAPDGSRFAAAFAAGVLKASGVTVDLPAMKAAKTTARPAFRPIRRVVPIASTGDPTVVVDDDDPTLRMKKAVTVPSSRSARIGWTKDAMVVAERGSKATSLIWARPAGDPADAIRAFGLGSAGLAVAFRQADILWLGFTDQAFKPRGLLQRIQGTGTKVSSPALGYNGQDVAVAFANEAAGAWQIRVARARAGEAPAASEPWPTPSGGPGGPVSAAAIAGVDEARWLIVWVEGDASARVVRAQTCDAQLRPVGAPLEVSPPGSNSGQAAVALARGKGAIGFFTAAGPIQQVWAAPISCP